MTGRFTIEIYMPRDDNGEVKIYNLLVPAIPELGTYISSEKRGFSGNVTSIAFYEDEDFLLHIQVRLR